MSQSDHDAILNLSNNKIDRPEFFRRFSENFQGDEFWLSRSLEASLLTQDAVELECVMLVGFAFGFHWNVPHALQSPFSRMVLSA